MYILVSVAPSHLAMFQRLGEIYDNHEVYLTDLDHEEVPALFLWFPNQEDYKPPPSGDETTSEKLVRITQTIKVRRSEERQNMKYNSRQVYQVESIYLVFSRQPGLRYRRHRTAPISPASG